MKNKSRIARLALAAVMGAAALSAQAATYEYDATALAAASGDETTFTYDSEGRIVSLTFSGGGTDDTAFTGDMTFAPDAAIKLSGKGTRRLVLNGAVTATDTSLTVTNTVVRSPYAGAFLPSAADGTTVVVFPNASVDDYDIVSTLFGTSSNKGLGTPNYVVRETGKLEVQLSTVENTTIKCVKVRLSQSGDDVVGCVVWARYSAVRADGTVPDFETLTPISSGTPGEGQYRTRDIATSTTSSGYGIDQLTVSPRHGNATVVLNGKVTGDLAVASAVDVRVQGAALANWSSKVLGAEGRVTFVGEEAATGPVTASRDENSAPSRTASLFMANQTLAGLKVTSARLGGSSISKTGVDAYVAALTNEGNKAWVWVQYLNAKSQLQAVKAVFTQVGADVYVAAERRGYITDDTSYGYGADLDALIDAGVAKTDTTIVTNITKSGYCLAGITVEFPNAAQSACVNLPGGTTLNGGTFALEGSVACVAAARDSLPTNGCVTVGSGSRLFASYASKGSSDGLCGGALDIAVLSGGSLAVTEKYALVASQPVSCDGGEIAISAPGADTQVPLDNLTLRNGAVIRGASFRMGNDLSANVVQATLRVDGTAASTAEAPLLLVGKAANGGKEQTVTLDVADVTGSSADDFVLASGIGEFAGQRAATKVVKAGAGTVSCLGAMNYGKLSSASTVLEEGVWRLAASSVTHEALAFTVAGGTLAAAADTANALGVLTVASSGGLSVGEGASLAFADSSGATWDVGSDVKLSIEAASGASVRFGTSASGLTDAQLRRVRLNGKRVILDENGYVQLRSGTLLIIR